jgi:plasmid stabilization system protein ParE
VIRLRFTPLALADIDRARDAIVAHHPDGALAGEHLAYAALARLLDGIERLRTFPRLGRSSHRLDILLLTVPGPTRHLTYSVGYRAAPDHVAILGITWGGRRFAP